VGKESDGRRYGKNVNLSAAQTLLLRAMSVS
jgi:hypothetical protein